MPSPHQLLFDKYQKLTCQDLRGGSQLIALLQSKMGLFDDTNFIHQQMEPVVRLFADVIREVFGGRYQGLPLRALCHILGAVDYLLDSGEDTPDAAPHGMHDDMLRLTAVARQFQSELQAFKDWRSRQA